jgi:hypothetical protein
VDGVVVDVHPDEGLFGPGVLDDAVCGGQQVHDEKPVDGALVEVHIETGHRQGREARVVGAFSITQCPVVR